MKGTETNRQKNWYVMESNFFKKIFLLLKSKYEIYEE
jgi:hypothetical protein